MEAIMQVLVLYYSRSGTTKKLAEAVGRGVESVAGVSAVLKHTEEVTKDDFLQCAGLVAGSPTYFGVMAAELKKIFDDFVSTRKKMEGKVGAAFATSADPSGGKETTMISIIQCLLIYGLVVVGDPMSATGHYGTSCAGQPDQKTLDHAAKLGRRVAELCVKLGK
jgi:NAD(P)H dehydrogenase (quinone)